MTVRDESDDRQCAVCGESVDYGEEILGVTMSDYVDTAFGQKPPVWELNFCAHHTDQILNNAERMEWEESVL